MVIEFDNAICKLKIADDYYSATMTLIFSDPDPIEESDTTKNLDLTLDGVLSFVKESGIVYGLKDDVIRTACESKVSIYDLHIAEGIPHQNGIDATIEHQVNLDVKPVPKLNEDGSVDFKEMNFIPLVSEGDVLVIKTLATEGNDGTTVTNKVIKGKNGKDQKIPAGDNTYKNDDETELLAEVEGIVKIINGRITVVRLMEIKTVGPETGNINFSGDVHVIDNVLDGYTVNCDGNLTIDGSVEGSTLHVRGDLIIGKGIMGHGKSDIVVDGSLIVKFIENAKVYAKGRIETNEIVNSMVLCDNEIVVLGKKGHIVGGETTAKYLIEAKTIGSKMGVRTKIYLGVDASVVRELKELKEAIKELKNVANMLRLDIPVIEVKILAEPENESLKEKLKQYKASLLSTEIFYEEKEARLAELIEALSKAKKGQVKVNTLYPDSVVKIGDSRYVAEMILIDCIIRRSNNEVIAEGF